MKSGSTFNLSFNIPDIKIDCVEEVIFTFAKGVTKNEVILTKAYPTEVVFDNDKFIIPLSQEDTETIEGYVRVEAQVNFLNKSVVKTDIATLHIDETLFTKFIEGNEPSEDNIETFSLIVDGELVYGKDGADGKSAYEIAVDEGFVGTEEEWLASLKGEQGERGSDGKDGLNGRDGIDGKDGINGTDGYTPIKGVDYFDGEKGEKGDKGDNYNLTESDKEEIAEIVKEEIPTGGVSDVQVNGTSIVADGVANIPIASKTIAGAVKIGNALNISDGSIYVTMATDSHSKAGTDATRVISAKTQNASTFYGLASASGDTTQAKSSNPVGTYTDEAKASIRNMLGITDGISDVTVNGTSIVSDGVADIPLASSTVVGALKINGGMFAIKSGALNIVASTQDSISKRYDRILTGKDVDNVIKYGLTDGKGAEWTEEEKAMARARLGIVDSVSAAKVINPYIIAEEIKNE